jgi:hypothetical protein
MLNLKLKCRAPLCIPFRTENCKQVFSGLDQTLVRSGQTLVEPIEQNHLSAAEMGNNFTAFNVGHLGIPHLCHPAA